MLVIMILNVSSGIIALFGKLSVGDINVNGDLKVF